MVHVDVLALWKLSCFLAEAGLPPGPLGEPVVDELRWLRSPGLGALSAMPHAASCGQGGEQRVQGTIGDVAALMRVWKCSCLSTLEVPESLERAITVLNVVERCAAADLLSLNGCHDWVTRLDDAHSALADVHPAHREALADRLRQVRRRLDERRREMLEDGTVVGDLLASHDPLVVARLHDRIHRASAEPGDPSRHFALVRALRAGTPRERIDGIAADGIAEVLDAWPLRNVVEGGERDWLLAVADPERNALRLLFDDVLPTVRSAAWAVACVPRALAERLAVSGPGIHVLGPATNDRATATCLALLEDDIAPSRVHALAHAVS